MHSYGICQAAQQWQRLPVTWGQFIKFSQHMAPSDALCRKTCTSNGTSASIRELKGVMKANVDEIVMLGMAGMVSLSH